MSRQVKEAFEAYLYEENKDGSGKANSYLNAFSWLSRMLQVEPYGFADAINIWTIDSVERLMELRELVLEEQKKKSSSPWSCEGIPPSYLRDGYCSAALTQLIEFLPIHAHSRKVLDLFNAHQGDEDEIAEKLNLEPSIPDGYVYDPTSKDGQDRMREAKARIGQKAFREVIFKIYQNRCCLTGLDLPQVNRASHIIGWAERKDSRMDPRNGLCLSATYDAAFDRKLITFDEDYRLVLSKTVRDHYPTESLQTHFLDREGQRINVPRHYQPLREYLESHRKGGDF